MPIYSASVNWTRTMFLLKLPVPEDTQTQSCEGMDEEDSEEEDYVSTVHYKDHVVNNRLLSI